MKVKFWLSYAWFVLTHNMKYENLVFNIGRGNLKELLNNPIAVSPKEKTKIIKYAKKKYNIDIEK